MQLSDNEKQSDGSTSDDELTEVQDPISSEKIINSVRLQFDPDMEIFEFHEMMESMETAAKVEEPEPFELNSFEFFVQALSHFEGENSVKTNRVQ